MSAVCKYSAGVLVSVRGMQAFCRCLGQCQGYAGILRIPGSVSGVCKHPAGTLASVRGMQVPCRYPDQCQCQGYAGTLRVSWPVWGVCKHPAGILISVRGMQVLCWCLVACLAFSLLWKNYLVSDLFLHQPRLSMKHMSRSVSIFNFQIETWFCFLGLSYIGNFLLTLVCPHRRGSNFISCPSRKYHQLPPQSKAQNDHRLHPRSEAQNDHRLPPRSEAQNPYTLATGSGGWAMYWVVDSYHCMDTLQLKTR